MRNKNDGRDADKASSRYQHKRLQAELNPSPIGSLSRASQRHLDAHFADEERFLRKAADDRGELRFVEAFVARRPRRPIGKFRARNGYAGKFVDRKNHTYPSRSDHEIPDRENTLLPQARNGSSALPRRRLLSPARPACPSPPSPIYQNGHAARRGGARGEFNWTPSRTTSSGGGAGLLVIGKDTRH